jgi:molecular chaperone DnaK (HSP70)
MVRVRVGSERRAADQAKAEVMIGIDFGTAYSRIGWHNRRSGAVEILPNADGKQVTPSIVHFGASHILVGDPARLQAADPDQRARVYAGSKLSFMDGSALPLPDREAAATAGAVEVIRRLRQDAEHFLAPQVVKRVALSCPSGFERTERDGLQNSAVAAGFEEVVLVDEPIAVALAYDRSGESIGDHLLVCDLGAGLSTVALVVRTEDGGFRLARPAWTQRHGGDDFDRAVSALCEQASREDRGPPLDPDWIGSLQFRLECRDLKEELSRRAQVVLRARNADGTSFSCTVRRDAFEAAIRPSLEETTRAARSVVAEAVEAGHPIDTVLLVGGSSRIPLARRLLLEAVTIEPKRWPHSDYAVALGAAHFANDRWGGTEGHSKTRVRVESTTTLSDLIHRLADREAHEREHMESEAERQRRETCSRVLGVFTSKAASIATEYDRLRQELAQRLANRELAKAQELASAMRRLNPVDTEVKKAQDFLDAHHEKIGEVRSIATAADVLALVLNVDGSQAIASTVGNVLVFCDLQAGTIGARLTGHSNVAGGVTLHGTPPRCASGSLDQSIRLWSLEENQQIISWAHGASVHTLSSLPGTEQLAAGGEDGKIKLWNTTDQTVICTFEGHNSRVRSVASSPDGSLLLSGGADGTVRLWDVQRGREIRKMTGHRGEVSCVRFFPAGRLAVSTSQDGTTRLWDSETGREMGRWEGHEGPVHCIEFTPDGRHAVSGGEDKTVRVWDVLSGWEVRNFTGHTGAVRCLAVNADGSWAVTGSIDKTVRVWSLGVALP